MILGEVFCVILKGLVLDFELYPPRYSIDAEIGFSFAKIRKISGFFDRLVAKLKLEG